jgi:hypothetical protein
VPGKPKKAKDEDVECNIQLEHTTIKELGPGISHLVVHRYLLITVGDRSEVLEGVGEPLINGFLNAHDSPSGVLQDDNPTKDKTDFDAQQDTDLSNEEICQDVIHIKTAERRYEEQWNNKISYHLRAGPNSNSFARYLLSFAPDLGNVRHSRRAVGWSTLILGR